MIKHGILPTPFAPHLRSPKWPRWMAALRRQLAGLGRPEEQEVERYVSEQLAHRPEPGDTVLVNWAVESGQAARGYQ